MLFNKNLLNEEKLRRLLEEKEAELAHWREERTRRQEEHEGYVKLRDTLREQKVTEQLYEAVHQEIRDIEEECAELAAAVMQAKESVLNLRREEKSLEDGLRTLEREAARRELQTEELRELTDAYGRYLEEKEQLARCRARLAALQQKREELCAELERLALAIRTQERGREDFPTPLGRTAAGAHCLRRLREDGETCRFARFGGGFRRTPGTLSGNRAEGFAARAGA